MVSKVPSRARDMCQYFDLLPSMYEALSPTPIDAERKRTKPNLTLLSLFSNCCLFAAKPTNVKISKYLLVLYYVEGKGAGEL